MAADSKGGRALLTDKDFVDLVDEAGTVVGSVPKHWADTELPPGTSRKGAQAEPEPPAEPHPVPSKDEKREALETYAVEHAGLTAEDAKAFGNKDELHAAIVAAKADQS